MNDREHAIHGIVSTGSHRSTMLYRFRNNFVKHVRKKAVMDGIKAGARKKSRDIREVRSSRKRQVSSKRTRQARIEENKRNANERAKERQKRPSRSACTN